MDLLEKYIDDPNQPNLLTDSEVDEQVKSLTELAICPASAERILPSAYALIRSAPQDVRPQMLAATLLEKTRRREHMCDTWGALFDRFPQQNSALRYWIRWLNREGRTQESVDLLQRLFADADASDMDPPAQAELYSEIRDPDAADGLFSQLIDRYPDDVRIRVIFGKNLFARGEILSAFEVLDPVRGQRLSPTAKSVMEKNDRAILAMETIRPNSATASPTGPDALFNAISLFHQREPRAISRNQINGISFYTGSLGAGGAERQLTQIASALHHRARTARGIEGTVITGTVDVIVNSLDAQRGKNFFEDQLKSNGVPLSITQEMPKSSLGPLPERLSILEDLLPILPSHAKFGLERLAMKFQKEKPDVVYIWQDGAVLIGALAALVAEVPRIAISLRGLPPNLRPHLMKPEYQKLYQALADVPGVTFSCNSQRAADEYCSWLDLKEDAFSVLYNALLALDETPSDTDQALWDEFAAKTEGATFTMGGIFRLTPNKRGQLWVDYAAEALKHHPDLRFIHVGDGDEMDLVQSQAKRLGIADRFLFVGKSNSPGFWYQQMDAVALLSENEGLPNVLIEAQYYGRPVISTPAGGAQETFNHGETGFLMSSTEQPDGGEFQGYLNKLIENAEMRATMGRSAKELARSRFTLDHVLGQTVRHFHGARISPIPPSNVRRMPRRMAPVAAPQVQDAYSIFANN